jgi:hypothetical protein
MVLCFFISFSTFVILYRNELILSPETLLNHLLVLGDSFVGSLGFPV